jgi:hypothetical protein
MIMTTATPDIPAVRTEPDQTWTVDGSTRLAQLVAGICRTGQFDADRLVGAMFDSTPREVAFETRAMLTSSLSKHPIGEPVVFWRISQIMEQGPGGGRFKLECWDTFS